MCERLSPDLRLECNNGQGCCIYKSSDQLRSCDKKDHVERSIYHQSNHQKHWNKQNLGSKLGIDKVYIDM